MEGIQHRIVNVNRIQMHVAEKGEGPVVLFLHGFPELWYSWRHQIVAVSSLGYRAVAPDLRGYGDTDSPTEINSYTCLHLVGDLVALIDSLGVDQVFLVGHDWGALLGWYLCLFRPEKIKAYVCLSVPFGFVPSNPKVKPVDELRAAFGDDYYICRFQLPGEMEEEIARTPTAEVIRSVLTTRATGPPIMPNGAGMAFNPEPAPANLPSWLTEQDIAYYASKFDSKGFTGGLNYYRCLNLNWELTAPWIGAKVKVPTKFLVGDLDCVYTTPGMKEYIHEGGFKKDVPNLEEVVVMEGVGHFNNQERAEEISTHIYEFIKNKNL